MRVTTWIVLAVLAGLTGCSKDGVRVGGMMCPENTYPLGQESQATQELQECPYYGPSQEKAAGDASYPSQVKPESGKSLEDQGYKISE